MTTIRHKGLSSERWAQLISLARANGPWRTVEQLQAYLREKQLPWLQSISREAIIEAARHAGLNTVEYLVRPPNGEGAIE